SAKAPSGHAHAYRVALPTGSNSSSWRCSKGSLCPWVGLFPNLGRQSFPQARNRKPRLQKTKARARKRRGRTRALLQLPKRLHEKPPRESPTTAAAKKSQGESWRPPFTSLGLRFFHASQALDPSLRSRPVGASVRCIC